MQYSRGGGRNGGTIELGGSVFDRFRRGGYKACARDTLDCVIDSYVSTERVRKVVVGQFAGRLRVGGML